MRALTLPNTLYTEKKTMSRTALEASLENWKLTLVVGSVFGGICGLVGMILGLMSLLGFLNNYPLLNGAGTLLLVIAFPLIILAAHSLDKAYEIDKEITIQYCRQTGMTDKEGE